MLGIVPTSELIWRSRVCNDVHPLIVLGIVPTILLSVKFICVILPKLPIEDGKVSINNKLDTTVDCTLP